MNSSDTICTAHELTTSLKIIELWESNTFNPFTSQSKLAIVAMRANKSDNTQWVSACLHLFGRTVK